MSHPVWVRGLKQQGARRYTAQFRVAPRVGAWIETDFALPEYDKLGCRTPCGCVD